MFRHSAIPFLLSHIPPFRRIESPNKTSLKLDGSGTEILVIVSCQQLAVVNIDNIQVSSSDNRGNLGAWFDSSMTMKTHLGKVLLLIQSIKRGLAAW